MNIQILNLAECTEFQESAARVLLDGFREVGKIAWATYEEAMVEVQECTEIPNIAICAVDNNKVVGWVGIRPMYDYVWELHPMIVTKKYQKKRNRDQTT